MNPVELSIVIPVYNSEDCLAELYQQITTALQSISYELIFVNDKSKDRSWDKIVSILKTDPKVKGVSLKKNAGQDNAIMAGLTFVRGNFVVIMDDDLQHSPFDILKLYDKCKEGYDVCYGCFEEKKQNLWKNAGSSFNNVIAELFLKKPKGLYLSPFKIIRFSLIKEIVRYNGAFPYVDGIILSTTSNITQIKLLHLERYDGKGNYNVVKSASVFLKHVTGFSLYPIRVVTLIGLLAAAFSFLLGVYYLIDYFGNKRHVEGWITLVILLVFFNGLILICLGLMGEYVGRIYLTVTAKAQYVIDKIEN